MKKTDVKYEETGIQLLGHALKEKKNKTHTHREETGDL